MSQSIAKIQRYLLASNDSDTQEQFKLLCIPPATEIKKHAIIKNCEAILKKEIAPVVEAKLKAGSGPLSEPYEEERGTLSEPSSDEEKEDISIGR